MPDIDFVSKYREALACYTEADFEKFFELGGIEGQELQDLGKDFLGLAGALYLSTMERQARQNQKTETLKHLARAQRASRDLADSLSKALQDRSMISALMEASSAARTAYPDDDAQTQDSYKILNSIFPLSGDGNGFRYGGLSNALTILAECISRVEADTIAKPTRGRKHALQPWAQLMFVYWMDAKGAVPRSGHYDREIADYDSPEMACLSFAAECLDSELTSRMLASVFGSVLETFMEKVEEPFLLTFFGFSQIIGENAAVSNAGALDRYLKAPSGTTTQWQQIPRPSVKANTENTIVSPEEFFETLKSTDGGIILLRSLMAMRQR